MPKKGQKVAKKCANCAYKDGTYDLYRDGVKVDDTAGMCTHYSMNRQIVTDDRDPCRYYIPKYQVRTASNSRKKLAV